ncbi:hypothetical protein [Bradyrhizobium sp. SZCCHNRI1058]|uniref:hypothetical protein n=1 Tax=Bradyrhizobium sp. SZCCHNRI1058 TaxID=3057279 RepID=UPI002916C0E6|nr:hypothetical protein [Bradyrhizobium sp. SZCCHNRI1058]
MLSAEAEIDSEQICSLQHVLELSVCEDLSVRVRIRGADGQTLADIATTPKRALRIAGLFKLAAERADPLLVKALA